MGFSLHADNSDDPPEVRNWRIHMVALGKRVKSFLVVLTSS